MHSTFVNWPLIYSALLLSPIIPYSLLLQPQYIILNVSFCYYPWSLLFSKCNSYPVMLLLPRYIISVANFSVGETTDISISIQNVPQVLYYLLILHETLHCQNEFPSFFCVFEYCGGFGGMAPGKFRVLNVPFYAFFIKNS